MIRWIMNLMKVLCMLFRLGPERVLELEKETLYDELTGALSKKALKEMGGKEVYRSHRFKHPLSLIFIDLDNFKDINDKFGHNRGDELLKKVASSFQACCREADEVFRFGGDEFVIILPETGKEGARDVMERIESKLFSLDLEILENIKIEISWGVAKLKKEESLNDLLSRADQDMYKNKKEKK